MPYNVKKETDMANFTEKAIKAAFLELLEERPLNKITVKDLAEKCEISRNSFYYHFKDIPSLIESITQGEFDIFIKKYSGFNSLGEALSIGLEFVMNNKKAILNIYKSENRELYEKYLWKLCEHISISYFSEVEGVQTLSEENRQILIRLFKCEVFGVIAEWMESGMQSARLKDIRKLENMKKSEVEMLVVHLGGEGQ